ncbi:DUF6932 family protein [Crocosphaera sp. XPORK-15E]|uniref:DUF6932 family protein n=1 Tax=Crocosphaera sp. XPORK-15E TaxID=3110247 RepID=UPI002B1F1DAF|nr:hypothetical protein [Crocosphaera sp. XPORK-15E]MEA5533681.1 hypothetical protein [Crocosphaera sp. XPORK-15E]
MSIPKFEKNGNLPAGIHLATWQEVENILGFGKRRQKLIAGLKMACEPLKNAGCRKIYIGGSFATNKRWPQDFDICWDEEDVNLVLLNSLEPILWGNRVNRAAQKSKYGGELFPASMIADELG